MSLSQEIAWGDGSGDKIYITAGASEGNQIVQVSSDPNTGSARTKTITFAASGVSPVTLTINQEAGRQPQPAEDGRIWLYVDVNSATSATRILYSNNTSTTSNLTTTMLVDGESKTRKDTYTFPTTGSHLVQFNLVSNATSILANQFRGISRGKYLFVPEQISSLGNNSLYQSGWSYIVFRRTTPPTYAGNALYGSYPIYVPWSADHSVLNSYKTAWSSYKSRIKELNEDGTVPTT